MATARPFAYNPSLTPIAGTTQVGTLAVGAIGAGAVAGSGVVWWDGPDEDLGYVIAVPVSGNTQPTPISGVTASVGFYRSNVSDSASFISWAQYVSIIYGTPQSFTGATQASTWLTANGYWNSYTTPTLAGSLLFNGTNQTLSLSPGVTFGSGAFTFEGWFYSSNVTNKGVLGPTSASDGSLQLYFSNSTNITSDKNGGGGSFTYTFASAITLNTWHYLIYNRNANGTTAIYIDGVRSTATVTDSLNYIGSTSVIGQNYQGYYPGYWTNMRMTIGTAVYDSTQTTQATPTTPLTSLPNTKYLMLGAAVTTDSSGTQTVTNNNGVTQTSSVKPF